MDDQRQPLSGFEMSNEISTLCIQCPHCEHEAEDFFEVLDPDVLDDMRCENCGKHFSFALMECHRCANEHIFTWPHEPSEAALNMLTCEACGSTFRYSDEAEQDQARWLG